MATTLSWFRSEKGRGICGGLTVLGVTLLVVVYLYVSNHDTISGQVAMIVAGGVAAFLLVGLGGAGLIVVDLLDEWHKLDRIEACLRAQAPETVVRVRPLRLDFFQRATIIATAGSVVGLVFGLVGWSKAGGAEDADDMFGALSIGAVGLVIAGAAIVLATLAVMRRVRLRGSELFAPWIVEGLRAEAPERRSGLAISQATDERSLPDQVIFGSDLSRFHTEGCPVVSGRDYYEHIAFCDVPSGVGACGICLGDLQFEASVDETVEMAVST